MSYSCTDQGEIVITQGDSGGPYRVELYEADDITPRNLEGLTATISIAKVRINDKGETVVSPAILVKHMDPNLNDVDERHVILFDFLPEDTNNMKVGEWQYDVELTDGADYVETVVRNTFTVEYQITKEA